MGAFDDLVPGKAAPAQVKPKPQSGGAFADLIPAGAAKPPANDSDFARMITGNAPAEVPPATYNFTGVPGVSTQIGGALDAFQHRALTPLHGAAQFVEGKLADYGVISPETVAQDDAALRQREADFQARTRGNAGAKVGGLAGDTAAAVALTRRIPMPATGVLPRLVAGGAGGALYGASQPVLDEGDSRLRNTAIGAGLGLLGQATGDALLSSGKRASEAVSPHVRKLWEAAKARGIELTPAQLSDSKLVKFLQSQFGLLPGAGAQATADTQRAQFNRSVARSFGEEADAVTPEVYSRAKARQSAAFEELTARNNLRIDQRLINQLEEIGREADVVGGETAATVRNAIDNFIGRAQVGDGGVFVPGKAYQAFDSQVGKVAMRGTPTAHYVGQVKTAVRKAMDESISPADKDAWAALRREYGNRKTVRDVVTEEGIAPQSLMGRVRSNNAGKEAMASGTRGELGELANIGQRMKAPPSSGTAERSLVNNLLDPLQWPRLAITTPLGASVGRVANSNLMANYVMRPGAGQLRQNLAPVVQGIPAALLPYMPAAASTPRKKKKP